MCTFFHFILFLEEASNVSLSDKFFQAHTIGGFSASFSSKDVCRFCHCTYDDLPHNIHKYGSKPHEIWTVNQYDSICRKLEENLSDSYGDTEAIEQMYSVQDDEYELEEIESDSCSDSDSEHDDFGVKNVWLTRFLRYLGFFCFW